MSLLKQHTKVGHNILYYITCMLQTGKKFSKYTMNESEYIYITSAGMFHGDTHRIVPRYCSMPVSKTIATACQSATTETTTFIALLKTTHL